MFFESGGVAQTDLIPLCTPEVRGNEWSYVKDCLDTGWVSSAGGYVDRFERELGSYVGAKHSVAVVNGTAALHVALLLAGVEPDDEVLVSALTFIAPANAVRYVGAWPVFIDAELETWQMDPELVVDFIEKKCRWQDGALRNRQTGRRVKAILPVHILGHPVDIDPIIEVAGNFGLPVIEDATESLGSRYKERAAGTLGDVACFSFNGNKIMTTGGGGMIMTDREDWAEQARYLTTQAKDDPVEYVHRAVGFNYRLTNVQAALGCAQLEQLDDFVEAKRQIAQIYESGLGGVKGITTMPQASWAESCFWMYTVLVDEEAFGADRRELRQMLSEAAIESCPLWQPLHRSPAHADAPNVDAPNSEFLQERALSLPCSVGLETSEQERVIDVITRLA